MNKRIVHISSVHARYDNRILIKECTSLAKADFDVSLFIADGKGNELFQGVSIIDVGVKKGMFHRLGVIVPRIVKQALKIKPEVFHFHDPELIPAALLLRILGYKVIYDIHEDYTTSIRQKPYLNSFIAKCIAFLFNYFEKFSAVFFTNIIAEKYYADRFPNSTAVLNYPILSQEKLSDAISRSIPRSADLIYTGNITYDRGALNHAKVLNKLEHVSITMVGKCNGAIVPSIEQAAGAGKERLKLIGVNTFVNPEYIGNKYKEQSWLAGLALFPKTYHYEKKELTKFFEYMKYGIPIICSDFPHWKELIEDNECGFAVDPDRIDEIDSAINQLLNNPSLYIKMSENGMNLYNTKFNWSIEEKKLIALYAHILES